MEDLRWNCSAVKKPKLFGEDLEQLKLKLKERKKKLSKIPRIRLLLVGDNAKLNVDSGCRIPVFLNDIQHLLLYSLMGNKSPYLPERWCKLDKYNQVQHVVVFVVEGLTVDHYQSNESRFEYLTSKMDYKLELITPEVYGGSVVEELVTVPLTGVEKSRLLYRFGSLEAILKNRSDILKHMKAIFPVKANPTVENNTENKEYQQLPETDKFSRTELILSPYQLIDSSFPLPLKGGLEKKYSDFVLTKDEYTAVGPKSKMYGIDCEMCETVSGLNELTRISIVDEALNVVYDTLVKPDNKITNYLTPYSGITKEMMKNVTTKLSDVQKFIRSFLPSDAILVGQSLENDLCAMKMMHPYIIDTSIIFNITGYRYAKTKLKTLTSIFLKETIQNSKDGHDSIEDSAASMKLVKLKLANSIHFGDTVLENLHSNQYISKYKKDNRNLKLNNRPKNDSNNYILRSFICNHLTKEAKTTAIVGCMKTINDYSKFLTNSRLRIIDDKGFRNGDNVRLIITQNNKETVTRCSEVAMEHALSLCHVNLKKEELKDENINKTVNSVDKWIKKLWKHTAQHGLICVIFSGETSTSNGACFLTIKKEIDAENICESP